jgi:hypothetical protein
MMSMLCNCCVRELLILARTWFAFGLPSKTGCVTIPALNAHVIRSVGRAIQPRSLHNKVCPSWASGEPRVRSLPEEALGRGVNPPGTTVPARGRGWAQMRSRPLVDEALT